MKAVTDHRMPGEVWAESARALVGKGIANGTCDPHRAKLNLAAADFAEKHNVVPSTPDTTASLWGYGAVRAFYIGADGGWWTILDELVEPTGVNFATLLGEFRRDLADDFDDVDVMTWIGPDGETDRLELVEASFAMRILAGVSPWSKEFSAALMPVFRRAMQASGLGDALGPVIRILEDGTAEQTSMSFNEFMSGGEPLPTAEEAREQAFRGPVIP